MPLMRLTDALTVGSLSYIVDDPVFLNLIFLVPGVDTSMCLYGEAELPTLRHSKFTHSWQSTGLLG